MSGARLAWERDGLDWPNRAASRFVAASGYRWHVQELGRGPVVLLLHGTGAATHSWRDLAPLLAPHCRVVAPDLPAHGFTDMPPSRRLSLPSMAGDIARLLRTLQVEPALIVGHSAGAAIAARMTLDGQVVPRALMSLNGALLPLRGMPHHIFSPAAKLLAVTSLPSRLFAWRAGARSAVERLLASTGSVLDARGVDLYARLVRNPDHVAGALGMMSQWDLRPLERDLARLRVPLTLVTGANDRTVPPREALRVRELLLSAKVVALPRLGHLSHEESPQQVADLVLGLVRSHAAV